MGRSFCTGVGVLTCDVFKCRLRKYMVNQTQVLTIRLTEKLHRRLQEACVGHELSMSRYVRKILEEALEPENGVGSRVNAAIGRLAFVVEVLERAVEKRWPELGYAEGRVCPRCSGKIFEIAAEGWTCVGCRWLSPGAAKGVAWPWPQTAPAVDSDENTGISAETAGLQPTTWPTYGGIARGPAPRSEMVCAKCLKSESGHYRDQAGGLWCVGNVNEKFDPAPPGWGLKGAQELGTIKAKYGPEAANQFLAGVRDGSRKALGRDLQQLRADAVAHGEAWDKLLPPRGSHLVESVSEEGWAESRPILVEPEGADIRDAASVTITREVTIEEAKRIAAGYPGLGSVAEGIAKRLVDANPEVADRLAAAVSEASTIDPDRLVKVKYPSALEESINPDLPERPQPTGYAAAEGKWDPSMEYRPMPTVPEQTLKALARIRENADRTSGADPQTFTNIPHDSHGKPVAEDRVQSRSVLRREAAQNGEPAPDFSGADPNLLRPQEDPELAPFSEQKKKG